MQLLQILAIAACLILIVFIVEAIRRNRLNVRYAILWLGSASVLFALSVYRPLLDWVARGLGVSYPPSFLFLVAFLFLLSIVLHYSLVISSHRDSIRRLAQTIALLQRALEEERETRRQLGAGG
jgi:hypothetical protein